MNRNQAIREGMVVGFEDSLSGWTQVALELLAAADDLRHELLAEQGRLTAKDRQVLARYETSAADCYATVAKHIDTLGPSRAEAAERMRKRESELRAQAAETLRPTKRAA